MNVRLLHDPDVDPLLLDKLVNRWQLESDDTARLALVLTPLRLELRLLDQPKLGAVYVDFVSGAMAYRRQCASRRSEAVAKAVGIKSVYLPDIVDATAGLGRDAFILAAIGCKVRMVERHPVVAALLDDGLQRGYQDAEIGGWLSERLTLVHASSLILLGNMIAKPDTVYLDPMFPHRDKSALVKKEMQVFQSLIGADADADGLLAPARLLANKRVTVKRPNYAPPLANIAPQAEIKTKNHRFDLYMPLISKGADQSE